MKIQRPDRLGFTATIACLALAFAAGCTSPGEKAGASAGSGASASSGASAGSGASGGSAASVGAGGSGGESLTASCS